MDVSLLFSFRLACALAGLGLLGATAASLAAPLGFPWEIASHFHPHWAMLSGAGAIIALVLAMPRIAGGFAAMATLHIALVTWSLSGAAAPPAPDAPVVRAVWANLQISAPALEAVAGIAHAADAEIVALTELPPGARARLPVLFPESCIDHRGHGGRLHVAIIMRGPCATETVTERSAREASIPWPNVQRWVTPGPGTRAARLMDQVAALHPPPPMNAGRRAIRDQIIADTVANLDARDDVLILGDFNATPWSPVRRALKRLGWRRVDCGAPWRSTWFSRHIFIGLPIDAAYIQGDLAARCVVGPDVGSDHFPLIIEVARHERDVGATSTAALLLREDRHGPVR